MYFDSRFDRSSFEDVGDAGPECPNSHHLIDGRPLELDSSGASLAAILAIGDSEGLYALL
jgi:hypothetical protein